MESSQWNEIWEATCRIMEQKVVKNQLNSWIQPLELADFSRSDQEIKITLGAFNDFCMKWVKNLHTKNLEDALSQVMGMPCRLSIIQTNSGNQPSGPAPEAEKPNDYEDIEALAAAKAAESTAGPATGVVVQTGRTRGQGETNNIDPRYNFDSFVVGASNQFAHASAVAAAESSALYNPLFIYSPPGLGKTHLLHAIGNAVLQKNPDARVGYVSAETFVNQLIESLQRKKMIEFRRKYRDSYDILMIDDVQFIAGKVSSEEELFHTFNALHAAKKQMILTSDRPPKEIEKLEERVRTRFEWGLIADIQPPEIETRIAILKSKAEREDIYLPDDVSTFIATYVKSNVRELEGLLVKLQAQASLSGAEISLEMAKQELKNSIPEHGSEITVETIQNVVSRHYNIKLHDLKSSSRAKTVAVPRQIAMYLVRKYTGLGFKEIGSYFGGKDHTTVMHACNKIESSMDDVEIVNQVEGIQNLL